MISDWPETTQKLSAQLRDLRAGDGVADVMKAFSAMAQNATKAGALDAKTKELIALAIGVATRCDDCIAFHAKAAAKLGATPRGNHGDARHGDLYGRRAVGDVRQPRRAGLFAILRRESQA